jgi:phage/plasmid-like protein (TIGR03299 family)
MSHELELNSKGEASMFYVGEKPWHGLGTELQNPATAEEALKVANLDFAVKTTPALFRVGRQVLPIKDKFAVIRTDKNIGLGVVGKSYTPLQNKDAFRFFDPLVDRDEAMYHTAGVLNDGRKIWLLAKLPNSIILKGNDIIDQYCMLTNSHDGTSGVTVAMTNIAVVCNNTLQAALAGTKHKVSVRHTTNVIDNIETAHKILSLQNITSDALQQAYDILQNKKVNTEFIQGFLNALYPKKEENKTNTNGDRIREQLVEAFETSPGHELISRKGTAFGLYNAVTYYTNHVKEYKSYDQRLNSIWNGGAAKIEQVAFDLLLNMSKN